MDTPGISQLQHSSRVSWLSSAIRCSALSVMVFAAPLSAREAQAESRNFSVEDGVEVAHFGDQTGYLNNNKLTVWSPDGKKLAVVVRQGSVASGQTIGQLRVFTRAEILDYLDGDDLSPEGLGRIIHEREADSPNRIYETTIFGTNREFGINSIAWLSNEEIAFLGETEGEPRQLFVADLNGSEIRQITNHPRSIWDYTLDRKNRRIFFTTTLLSPPLSKQDRMIIAGNRQLHGLVDPDHLIIDHRPSFQLYVQGIEGGEDAVPLGTPFETVPRQRL